MSSHRYSPLALALRDAWRGRWLLMLLLGLLALGELLQRFSQGATAYVSLLDIALLVAPLAGLVVGTLQIHDDRELLELLLAQPVSRSRLFIAQYLGRGIPLALVIIIGLVAPVLWHDGIQGEAVTQVITLAGVSGVIAMISLALAFIIALKTDDRVRAVGKALGIWLVAAILWDGLILLIGFMLAEGPAEQVMLALLALNPLDIARILLLLGGDAVAMLGYTGAVVRDILGATSGRALLGLLLALWTFLPIILARRTLLRKDF